MKERREYIERENREGEREEGREKRWSEDGKGF